jgi:hypothetical protein
MFMLSMNPVFASPVFASPPVNWTSLIGIFAVACTDEDEVTVAELPTTTELAATELWAPLLSSGDVLL